MAFIIKGTQNKRNENIAFDHTSVRLQEHIIYSNSQENENQSTNALERLHCHNLPNLTKPDLALVICLPPPHALIKDHNRPIQFLMAYAFGEKCQVLPG